MFEEDHLRGRVERGISTELLTIWAADVLVTPSYALYQLPVVILHPEVGLALQKKNNCLLAKQIQIIPNFLESIHSSCMIHEN